MECVAHIPHKEWASEQERQNYLAIERWSRLLHDNPSPGVDAISLLLPYKSWSDNQHEYQNCLEIERWARHFQTDCIKKAGVGPSNCFFDDFNRENSSLGPNFPPLIVQDYDHQPFFIRNGAATGIQDRTGGYVWSEAYCAAIGTNTANPSSIEVLIRSPFAGAALGDQLSVQFAFYLDLSVNSGTCESFICEFRMESVDGGRFSGEVVAYDFLGRSHSPRLPNSVNFPMPHTTTFARIRFESLGNYQYRVSLAAADTFGGLPALAVIIDTVQETNQPEVGDRIGFASTWDADGLQLPCIDELEVCGDVLTPLPMPTPSAIRCYADVEANWGYGITRAPVRIDPTSPTHEFVPGPPNGPRLFLFPGDTSGHPTGIYLPAGYYDFLSLSYTFTEGNPRMTATDPGALDQVARTLELQVLWTVDVTPIHLYSTTVTGNRYQTTVTLRLDPIVMSAAVNMRAYVTFGNILNPPGWATPYALGLSLLQVNGHTIY